MISTWTSLSRQTISTTTDSPVAALIIPAAQRYSNLTIVESAGHEGAVSWDGGNNYLPFSASSTTTLQNIVLAAVGDVLVVQIQRIPNGSNVTVEMTAY